MEDQYGTIRVTVGVDAFGSIFFIELPEYTDENFWVIDHLKEFECDHSDMRDTNQPPGIYTCDYTVHGFKTEDTPITPSEYDAEAYIGELTAIEWKSKKKEETNKNGNT